VTGDQTATSTSSSATSAAKTPISSIVLAGGGTAGHVNPLLSVADEIRRRNPEAKILVLGTEEGLEADLVPARGYELRPIPRVPLPRRPSLDFLRLPARLQQAIKASREAIDEIDAQAVVGFGGYVSTPAYLAAHRIPRHWLEEHREVPVVVHEGNARPGIANRIGARWARRVATTFPTTQLRGGRWIGLPLRSEIVELAEQRERDPRAAREAAAAELGLDPDLPTLVVSGGSTGALSVNAAVAGAAKDLLDAGIQVLHLTGKGKDAPVREALAKLGDDVDVSRYHVREYLSQMQLALACADLVVARAGAGMVCELAALGLPAVYVPLPIGNGEQKLNATPLVEAGGGLLVSDDDFTAAWVREHIPALMNDAERLAAMSEAAREQGRPTAAAELVDMIEQAIAEDRWRAEAIQAKPATAVEPVETTPSSTSSATGYVPTPVEDLGRVHLIAIGGAGVSVIARLLAGRGVPVQGSDAVETAALQELRDDGITTWVGHDRAHLLAEDGTPLADTVVVSSAVRESNPELAAAREAGIPVLHRSQALASLMLGQRAVAVAGAHGKTTTSAMIAMLLREAGVDASYAIGGSVRLARGQGADGEQTADHMPGGHVGTSDILVAEADESDGSFLNYAPTIAVVTNVEPDHLDHFGSTEAFEEAFVQFAARIRPGGTLVACADDPGAARLAAAHRANGGNVVTYGTAPGADVVVEPLHEDDPASNAALIRGWQLGEDPKRLELSVPGEHNLLNATAAVITAALLGVDVDQAVAGVHAFVGTGRRFEPRGEAGGVRVIDDYAHHPTEIEALLHAARPVAGDGRVLVLFQPHLYSRTKAFADRFAAALQLADEAIVTGVYKAREDVDPNVGPQTITAHADRTSSGGRIQAVEDKVEAAHQIAALAQPGDLVLTVGAGDVTELGPVILADLA